MAKQRLEITSDKTLTGQLGSDGNETFYTVSNSATVFGGNQRYPFGVADFTNFALLPTEFNLSGGNFDHTAIDATNNIAIPLYGDDLTATIDIESLACRGNTCWGIQTNAKQSDIKIKKMYCEGLVGYSSYAEIGDPKVFRRTLKIDQLEVVNNRAGNTQDTGILRFQNGGGFTTGCVENWEIGTVHYSGPVPMGGAIYLQANTAGDGGAFSARVGSIFNETPASTVYTDYEKVSNNSLQAEIQVAGGAVSGLHTNTTFNFEVDSVVTPHGLITTQGIRMGNNSSIRYEIRNGLSTGQVPIFMPHPGINGNAKIIVEGTYRTTADAPVGMLAIDVGGQVIFRNCYFETEFAGREVFHISDDTINDVIVFENCTFINDGVTTAVSVDPTHPGTVRMRFIDCKTNSATPVSANVVVDGSITTI